MELCSRSLLSIRRSITALSIRSVTEVASKYNSKDPSLVEYRFMKVNPSSALVRNLYWSISKQDLKELASQYGKVEYINYPLSRSGFHRGLAEIKFEDDNSTQTFISQRKFMLDEQPCYAFAVPSENANSTVL